jgi:integrase
MTGVRPRGEGRWQLVYTVRHGGPKERKQAYETFMGTKTEAERCLREILSDLDRGAYVKRTKETTGAYLARWLTSYADINTSPRTAYEYRRIVARYLAPTMGSVALGELWPEDIVDMHQALLARNLGARTVIYAHRVLSKALSTAVRWRDLKRTLARWLTCRDPRGTFRRHLIGPVSKHL